MCLLIAVNDKYGNICIELVIWVILKLFFVLISVVPLSGGSVGFALAMGGVLGRAYGEFLKMYLGFENIGKFAMAGAAAMSSGIF